MLDLVEHLLLLRVDLLMAVHLELVILLLDLLVLGFLLVLVVHVVDVGVADQIISVPLLGTGSDLALSVVIVDKHLLQKDVKLSLLDLVGSWQIWIKVEFLGHLVDLNLLVVVVFAKSERLSVQISSWRESHRSVDELVWPVFVLLNNLVLVTSEELFTENQTVLLTMMVEVELSIAAVNLDELLPMVVK